MSLSLSIYIYIYTLYIYIYIYIAIAIALQTDRSSLRPACASDTQPLSLSLPASVKKTLLRRIVQYRNMSFWSAKSGAALQLLPKDCRAKAGMKGVLCSPTSASQPPRHS